MKIHPLRIELFMRTAGHDKANSCSFAILQTHLKNGEGGILKDPL